MVGKSRLSRNGAKICTWAGRASVLAAGGGAAMVLFGGAPEPDLSQSSDSAITAQNTEPVQKPQTGPTAFNEFALISEGLAAWNGPTPDADPGPQTIVKETTLSSNELAYLGIIAMGDRQRALVSIDGRQRFLREGQSYGPVTIVSIAQDHVMIRKGRVEQRIDRQAEPTERLGYIGNNGAPVQLSNPSNPNTRTFVDDGNISDDPSETRRQEIARRMENRSRGDGLPPAGVPAAKARNLPGASTDGQEGS